MLEDDGCDLAPHCLSCPFEVCQYDLPHQHAKTLATTYQDEKILALRAQGLPVATVARRLGISRRTVYRAARRAELDLTP